MQRRFLVTGTGLAWVLSSAMLWAAAGQVLAQNPPPKQSPSPPPTLLRVMTHSSFDLPKPLLAQFEKDAGVKLQLTKGGDAGEMLNKLILSRAAPVADVVFGIDNTLLPRALASGILDTYPGAAAQSKSLAGMAEGSAPPNDAPAPTADSGVVGGVVPVTQGFVSLNIDKAWFQKKGLALPQNLQALALPAYRDLLVVPNPATSSPGQAFLLATVAGLGEAAAWDWWAQMRGNGVKVVKGWSEAYYTEFSHNGGTRPMVVSYATSPAAEVFYSKDKLAASPTANLFLPGGVFRQVEGMALLKGAAPAARTAGVKFIEFLRSVPVQQALPTSMWMYPVQPGVPLDAVMQHAEAPTHFERLPLQTLSTQAARWQQRWTQVVLK
jgi:thiamine transport system substrate-binding protein